MEISIELLFFAPLSTFLVLGRHQYQNRQSLIYYYNDKKYVAIFCMRLRKNGNDVTEMVWC